MEPNLEHLDDLSQQLALMFYGVALWVVASELVHWMELYGYGERSYKVALSILFGVWAVLLIVTGIRQGRPSLRIAAMVLFAGTLVKLFIYDLEHLSTLSKTFVMVILGALLLLISYLYKRYEEQMKA